MYAYPGSSISSNIWQASGPSIFLNFRGALQNSSVTSYQQVAKTLTTEAVYMIIVLLAFAILTLIGSSLDLYEYLRKEPTKKKLSEDSQKRSPAIEVPFSSNEKNLSETTVSIKIYKQFLSCFSVLKNWKILSSTACNKEYITCLDGIRVFGLYMIMQSHIFGFYVSVLKNREEKYFNFFLRRFFPKAMLTLNSFLIISGIANGYSFSRQYRKSKGKISWLSLPFRTFVKFTPMVLIVVGFYTTLFSYMGSGPVWPKYNTNPVCKENWIWNLLYLNNFLPADQQCVIQTWYLACLLQLQIINPLLIIPIMRMPKIGYTFIAFVCVSSCLVNFLLFIKYNLVENFLLILKDIPDVLKVTEKFWLYFEVIHTKPYTRLNSYAAGIALGCYIHSQKLKNLKKYSLVKLSFGWIFCIFFLWLCTRLAIDSQGSIYEIAAFHCICPLFHAFGWSWIIFVCATKQSEILNKFLSCNFFKILLRVSFPAYLLHMIVLEKYFLSLEEPIEDSVLTLALISAYLYLWIFAASVLFLVIFGIPVSRMFDLLRKTYQKKLHQK